MNYIGSKQTHLPFLYEYIKQVTADDEQANVFCDIFAGTGAVGKYFKTKGYQIIANDIQYYSYVLNRQYIGNHSVLMFDGLKDEIPSLKEESCDETRDVKVCNYLDMLDPIEGFIYRNYCKGQHSDEDE